LNEAILLITKTINDLRQVKNKNATVSDGNFDYAPDDSEISNQFRGHLLIFNELIHLYELQKQGLIS